MSRMKPRIKMRMTRGRTRVSRSKPREKVEGRETGRGEEEIKGRE